MKLYNSLSKQVEEFTPLSPPALGVYSCGPTVYNRVHIGNLASFIYADTLRRVLKYNGLKVSHVMNLTDIDDKTVKSSQEKYPDLDPMEALKKLTSEYADAFMADMTAAGNDTGSYTFTNATDNIDNMQSLITGLIEQGFAYVADDGIYFSIEAYKKSGKTYGQLSEVTAGSTSSARIDNDEYDKESVHDFALWKKQKANEPAWDFQVAGEDLKGRPGWHIECSAMSRALLGQPFDIHTGGIDLIFPHHENEIAQSTAGQDNPVFASHFFHSNHVLVDGQKMSKSLNNFLTLDDVRSKNFDPLALRVLILQAQYRSQAHFSWENLEAAENRLQDLRAMAVLRWQPRKVSHDVATFSLEGVVDTLGEILNDDLNTPQALAFLSDVSTQLQAVHIEEDMVVHMQRMLEGIDALLGLGLCDVPDITEYQKQLLKEREEARASKDWAKADKLRAQLETEKIAVRDATHGVIWFRVK